MSLHYRPIVLVFYSSLDWVEKASEVAWVEQDEWFFVEVEVETIEKEVGWVEASTHVMGFSIQEVGEHMAKMIDWQVEKDIEEHKAKKEVWTMTDELKSIGVERVHSDWDANKSKIYLACPTGMVEVVEASFDL